MSLAVYSLQLLLLVSQGVVIFFLAFGQVRRYLFLFLYCFVDLVTGISEQVVGRIFGERSPLFINIYWTNEVLVDLLLFLLVIDLIRRVADRPSSRTVAGRILLAVLLTAFVLPFLYGHRLLAELGGKTVLAGRWFNVASQVLNFGGVATNLVLWGALLGSKRRDTLLLLVSTGLGLACTALAINYGIRVLTRNVELRSVGTILALLARIAGTMIWCWAFRPVGQSRESSSQ